MVIVEVKVAEVPEEEEKKEEENKQVVSISPLPR